MRFQGRATYGSGTFGALLVAMLVLFAACTSTAADEASVSPETSPPELASAELASAELASAELATPELATPELVGPELASAASSGADPAGAPTAQGDQPPTTSRIEANEQPAFDDRPRVWTQQPVGRVTDLDPVNLREAPAGHQTIRVTTPPHAPAVKTNGTTPDGRHIWTTTGDPSGWADCDTGTIWALATAPIDRIQHTPTRSLPYPSLPSNITGVYTGPQDNVLLTRSCGSHIDQPVALAKITPNGNFTDVRRIDHLFEEAEYPAPARWTWAAPITAQPSATGYPTGELVVVVPRVLKSTGQPEVVYLDANTLEIVEVWATSKVWKVAVGDALIVGDADGVELTSVVPLSFAGRIEMNGRIDLIEVTPSSASVPKAVLAGPRGAAILRVSPGMRATVHSATDRAVVDAAWSPHGDWVALTGPDGSWLFNSSGETLELSREPGEQIVFSPSGSRIVITTATGYEVLTYDLDANVADELNVVSTFDSGGLGPLRIEMRLSEINRAINGATFYVHQPIGSYAADCVSILSYEMPGMTMLGEYNEDGEVVVASIRVEDGPWKTPSGLRLGSTQDEVITIFDGQIDQEPRNQFGGSYLTFVPNDPTDNYTMVFETNGHEVTAIHAGRQDWISRTAECA